MPSLLHAAERLDTREGQQADFCLIGQSALIEILADAARGIAAHHGLRAVGIEDAHGEVGLGNSSLVYQHKTVRAYALVAVAPG